MEEVFLDEAVGSDYQEISDEEYAQLSNGLPVAASNASTGIATGTALAGTAVGGTAVGGTAVGLYYALNSIDVLFQNIYGQTILSGTCIQGKLNKDKLENGDYVVPTIVKTFEYLKTIKYNNSIIKEIKYKLSAFLSAITMSNQITDYTTKLSPQVFAGTLSNDDFNKSVSSYTKKLSDNYPNNYFMNLTKVHKAIKDNLHILTSK